MTSRSNTHATASSRKKSLKLASILGYLLPQSRRTRTISAYLISVLTVGAATLLRIGLDPVLGEHHPFTLYFAAVAIASWYGGLGPGFLAIVLSYFGADWFFISPRFEFNLPHTNLDEFMALMAFLFSSFAIAFTSQLLRQALDRARRKQRELELEIVERQRAEEALKQAQTQLRQYAVRLEERVEERTAHLQETIRSLEGVCYHIAHDLRAPLRAMEGYTNILTKEASDRLDPSMVRYLQSVAGAADRMDLLITALLEYGRLGHEQFPLRPVSAPGVLAKVLHELKAQITASGARVLAPDSCPEVFGNETLLFILFFNLLGNALKFVPPGVSPMIEISCETTHLDNSSIPYARFCVTDNGIGIPAERRHKAFWIFERLHPTLNYPGIGIGLALASKAVERMDGRIGIEPAPAKGSRFWFELPLSIVGNPKQNEVHRPEESLAFQP
jgi:signal transduction histidine kinase